MEEGTTTIGTVHYIVLDMMHVLTIDSSALKSLEVMCHVQDVIGPRRPDMFCKRENTGAADYGLCQISGRDLLTGGSHDREALHYWMDSSTIAVAAAILASSST